MRIDRVIIALLTGAVISQSIGNVLLTQGMRTIGGTSQMTWDNWASLFLEAAYSPMIFLGVGFMVIFFGLFTAVLSQADLSFVLPAISSEVVINVALADYVLDETVSPTRWIGALVISIGVLLVVRSSPRTFVPIEQDTGP
jgi:drug/metabolite transporter (DMT)-like permease